jgi:hypothetical protein
MMPQVLVCDVNSRESAGIFRGFANLPSFMTPLGLLITTNDLGSPNASTSFRSLTWYFSCFDPLYNILRPGMPSLIAFIHIGITDCDDNHSPPMIHTDDATSHILHSNGPMMPFWAHAFPGDESGP